MHIVSDRARGECLFLRHPGLAQAFGHSVEHLTGLRLSPVERKFCGEEPLSV